MKMTVFWDNAPYSLVEVNTRLGGVYCPHYQRTLKTEVVRTSESSVMFQGTISQKTVLCHHYSNYDFCLQFVKLHFLSLILIKPILKRER
jgi:hypothetical protein